jgi:HTH-type transcriptional regulator/antitoxin HigA
MVDQMVLNEYRPDYVSPPGETLLETLEMIGMSQAELARRMGRPHKTINEIIQGKTTITPETAVQLERVLGISAGFWIRREQVYQETLARLKEEKELEAHVEWLQNVPVKEMISFGWIKKFDEPLQQLKEVLGFFGIVSPAQWNAIWQAQPVASFRQSTAYKADPYAVAAWLREGERRALRIDCEAYESDRFKARLHDIRVLTTEPVSILQKQVVEMCAEVGVAVVFVRQLQGTRASGATYWISPDKALLQLSIRYKTNDHLWFTFFHEAAHILLHGKRDAFLEVNNGQEGIKELEADKFASAILIPSEEWERFVSSITIGRISKAEIRAFADEISIAPGIVVGRLQHEGLVPFSHCNDLKIQLEWSEN